MIAAPNDIVEIDAHSFAQVAEIRQKIGDVIFLSPTFERTPVNVLCIRIESNDRVLPLWLGVYLSLGKEFFSVHRTPFTQVYWVQRASSP